MFIDGGLNFSAEAEPRDDLQPGLEAKFIHDLKVLRFGHNHDKAGFLKSERQDRATFGHVKRDRFEGLGIHCYAHAIQVGNGRNFGKRGNEVNLGDHAALEQQFTQMNEFTLLIQECLVEVGRGEMAAFTQDFPQPLLFHGFTLTPGQFEKTGKWIQAEGGDCI